MSNPTESAHDIAKMAEPSRRTGRDHWRLALVGTEWIEEWFREYHAGRYRPLPIDRLKTELPAEFHSIVPFISAAAQLPAERGLTRDDLREITGVNGYRVDGVLLLQLAVLAAFENDYGLGQALKRPH